MKDASRNVLIISGFYYPSQMGGPSNTSYWMANALGNKGFQVTVVALNTGIHKTHPSNKWIKTEYGKVIYLSYWNINLALNYCRVALSEALKADVIHINSMFAPTSFIIAVVMKAGKTIFWAPRGEVSSNALLYNPGRKKWMIRVIKRLRKKFIFHVTSEQERISVQQLFGTDTAIVLIPNLVALEQQVNRNASKYLLFVGRVHPIKGLDKIVEALAKSSLFLRSGFSLYIAGDDTSSYANSLKQKVEDLKLSNQIRFIGAVKGKHKQELYANAYYLILPSDSENFGNVVVEALSQGTPVIASTGTPWQVLQLQNAGSWVSNSVEQMRSAIEHCLQLPEDVYEQQRINALRIVKENFDISTGINRWISCYDSPYAPNSI